MAEERGSVIFFIADLPHNFLRKLTSGTAFSKPSQTKFDLLLHMDKIFLFREACQIMSFSSAFFASL